MSKSVGKPLGQVWVTRAAPGAQATAERLRAAGLSPLVAPLLRIVEVGADLALRPGEALAFTSSAAVRAFAARSAARGVRVYAVGEATAETARAAGFKDVRTGEGDVAALGGLILRDSPAGGVAHLAGEDRAGDLEGALKAAGLGARTVAIYRTVAAKDAPTEVAAALASGRLEAVALHSPKAASALAQLAEREPLASALPRMRAIGLSPACLQPLEHLPFAARRAAERPTDAALIAALRPLSGGG